MKHYVYVLKLVPRLHADANWTAADREALGLHFSRLKAATDSGKVLLAGRTDEPLASTFGLVVFEAEDDREANDFMKSDPTLVAGVMTATLHPYSVALMRR